MDWIVWIVIGGLAGWIAEKIMKFDTGLVMNVILGVAGAVVGNMIVGLLITGIEGLLWDLVVAVLGACILIYVYKAVKQKQA